LNLSYNLMPFSNQQVRIQPVNILKSILFSSLLCCCLFACAFIPEQEQLVSATRDNPPTRSNGSCTETGLAQQQQDPSWSGLSPDSISIFDWNIYKEQNQGWDVDFMRLSYEADIILLQEASLRGELKKVLQQKHLYWNFNSAFKYKGLETGVLVASTVPPLSSCGLRTDEPIIGLPKTIVINTYGITGSIKKLLVANIHGINITLGTGSYQKQMDGLQNILEQHNGPIIMAGDFNNWCEERTAIMAHLVKSLSLQALTFDDEQRTTFFGDPVDHILYRGLKPVTYEVSPVKSSDHNPISVTFRLERI